MATGVDEGRRRRVLRGAAEELAALTEDMPPPTTHWGAGESSWQGQVVLRENMGKLFAMQRWGVVSGVGQVLGAKGGEGPEDGNPCR